LNFGLSLLLGRTDLDLDSFEIEFAFLIYEIKEKSDLILKVVSFECSYDLCFLDDRVLSLNDFLVELVKFEVALLLQGFTVTWGAVVLNQEILLGLLQVDDSETEVEVELLASLWIERQVLLQVDFIFCNERDLGKVLFAVVGMLLLVEDVEGAVAQEAT
jgi:hypothetical protein